MSSLRRYSLLLAVLFFTSLSCKRTFTRDDLEKQLITAMRNSLYERVNYDSSKVKFDVQSVNFFEEKTYYTCEFKVRLQRAGFDTTGYMGATISKDFKSVNRKY